ncbi:protein of unknown function DUF182 [Chthoniobacter flavus Ellin428]|uniref:XdhC- CoxI domain-containing protein n=1 Tax=Chthoniobacter flavus Ellin428 TaxID=497964 RepID=B4CX86_9BACT|nr:XdhC family protein [Chthoniobacter flavus]EDY20884.1 protein of unknown function DUF182 [Chthoniobacter flavus Ellin428]
MSEFARLVAHWSQHRSRRFSMATVVRTSGSTYRRAGARMLIDDSGETFGLVSGGCLEAEVSKHAAETLRSGRPELLAFDTRAQLGCRGTVEILVEAFAEKSAEQLFSTARGCFQQRRTLIGATLFGDDEPSDISFGSYPISTDGIHALAATELPGTDHPRRSGGARSGPNPDPPLRTAWRELRGFVPSIASAVAIVRLWRWS